MAWGMKGKGKPLGDGAIRAGGVEFDPPVDNAAPADANDTPEAAVVLEKSDALAAADPVASVDVPFVSADVSGDVGTLSPGSVSAGKRRVFGRGSKADKPVKLAKEPKPGKAQKAKRNLDEEISLPKTVVIDFYMGLEKEREAEQIARASIEKNFDAPNAAYLYTQKWRGGIAVEMQEGGGKAYLPEVLARLDVDPLGLVAVPMSNRFAQIRLDPDTKSLETLLLVENQLPPEDAFIALPTRPMMPFDRRGSKVFLGGVALLLASVIALMFSIGAFFIDTSAWAIPYLVQTQVKDLPSSQSNKIRDALASGDCIYKMEYQAGAWVVTSGFNNGGVCGTTRSEAIVEEQPGLDVSGGVPVTQLAPGGVPGVVPPVGSMTQGSAPMPGPGMTAPGAPPMQGPMAPGPMAPGAVPPGATPPVSGQAAGF